MEQDNHHLQFNDKFNLVISRLTNRNTAVKITDVAARQNVIQHSAETLQNSINDHQGHNDCDTYCLLGTVYLVLPADVTHASELGQTMLKLTSKIDIKNLALQQFSTQKEDTSLFLHCTFYSLSHLHITDYRGRVFNV